MGLAVATNLASNGNWNITILDLNPSAGAAAASSLKSTIFIRTDVNDYTSLASAFQKTFQSHHRLDFVFANAGVVERGSLYAPHPTSDTPPPPPDMLSIDIDLKSVVTTTWLAQHYFRLNPAPQKGGCLIMTSSVGRLYGIPLFPLYCAAKHGVIGLMRSIATPFFQNDKISVNAICPGTVRTNLLRQEQWDAMEATFVPIEKVVAAVEMLLDEGEGLYGKAVELVGEVWYFREQVEFKDGGDLKRTLEGPKGSGPEKVI
jgi:NAD(P)-dependent dehydrogenase (short-subunit alcohol dehydrogenase family)